MLLAAPMVLPFARLLDWPAFSHSIATEPGEPSAQAALAALADSLRTAHGLQRATEMLHRGQQVRRWFMWPRDGSLHSATGLLLFELHARGAEVRRWRAKGNGLNEPPCPP